jgi:hypothetical protein
MSDKPHGSVAPFAGGLRPECTQGVRLLQCHEDLSAEPPLASEAPTARRRSAARAEFAGS